MKFTDVFKLPKPVIACIHLMPLPGSPLYDGNIQNIYDIALRETEIYQKHGIGAIIIENFRDMPFYADKVPSETIAAMSSVIREIVNHFDGAVGVNVLRNDAKAAMSIATSTQADFIRVNVHTGAAVTDQGLIQGKAAETLRQRSSLQSKVLILADVNVKHASPLANRSIDLETKDTTERGLADGIIVTGSRTGSETDIKELEIVRQNTNLPIIAGSGIHLENLKSTLQSADGMIVGSYFKKDGIVSNFVEDARVEKFMSEYHKWG